MTGDDTPPAGASDRGVDTVDIQGHTRTNTSSPGGHCSGRVMTDGGRAVDGPRGPIVAAEVAVDERQLDRAEDALLLALSETRKLKAQEEGET